MYWFRNFSLLEAFDKLREVRPCNPRLQAIRQATCDVLFDQGKYAPTVISVSKPGGANQIQVSYVQRKLLDSKLLQAAASSS